MGVAAARREAYTAAPDLRLSPQIGEVGVRSCASWAVRTALLVGVLLVSGGSTAAAAIPTFDPSLPRLSDAAIQPSGPAPPSSSHHGPTEGHLPPTQQELEVVGFIPAQFPYYHGEGAHVVSVNTPQFQGDILAVNNETYGSNLALIDNC